MVARLFTAILPPPAVVSALEAFFEPRRDADDRLYWTRPQSWHLTTSFMESVDSHKVEPLIENLAEVASKTLPITIRLGGAGTFGRPWAARVLWLGLAEGVLDLTQLASRARTAGERAGIRTDSAKFVPHLTLARTRRPIEATQWIRVIEAFESEAWTANEFVLMQSHLRDRGHRYEQVERFSFIN